MHPLRVTMLYTQIHKELLRILGTEDFFGILSPSSLKVPPDTSFNHLNQYPTGRRSMIELFAVPQS